MLFPKRTIKAMLATMTAKFHASFYGKIKGSMAQRGVPIATNVVANSEADARAIILEDYALVRDLIITPLAPRFN